MSANPYKAARDQKGSPLYIPFAVLGDPDKEKSKEVLKSLVESGADALELGFPYSDPPADGPVIQAADTRALEVGITVDDCFELLHFVRSITDIPVGLLMYYNLILQRGVDTFYAQCKEAGVNSVLVADLPLEHMEEVLPHAKKHGVAPVCIVSELTTDDRIKEISAIADGYLYVVSYLGVTGVENSVFQDNVEQTLKRIRQNTDLPLCVGFGINSAEQVRSVSQAGADGVIVGSRIVKEVPNLRSIALICYEFANAF